MNKNNLICDCKDQGYPLPDNGECSKCGYEIMDRECEDLPDKSSLERLEVYEVNN